MKPKQNRIFNTLSALERGSSDILEKKMSGTEVKRSTLRYLLVRPRRDDRETAKNDTNAACNFVNYSILIPFLSPPPFEEGINKFSFPGIPPSENLFKSTTDPESARKLRRDFHSGAREGGARGQLPPPHFFLGGGNYFLPRHFSGQFS